MGAQPVDVMLTWAIIFKLLLELAVFAARRAEKRDIEKAVLDELQILNRERVDRAQRARDDVLAGRVPVDPHDPNRRD
ncbi:MAG: hypothetical protein K5872_22365 [Rhizobiaceae bacterium]|nr:hypothetical protein [Rhizobiaceae bacterium]MCV0408966.1 hypothetical protein [Rhizobiaceae bacterium]